MKVDEQLSIATRRLRKAGCLQPRADAEALLVAARHTESGGPAVVPSQELTCREASRLAEYLSRRCAGEPLAYITGRCAFAGVLLHVDRRVHVPHLGATPLVDLAGLCARGGHVHDVGTGGGAIALAIKTRRPDLTVTGSDLSAEAVAVAQENAARLGLSVKFAVADGIPKEAHACDLVVANLPFGALTESAALPREVGYQPPLAIFGGRDGLDVIRAVLGRAPSGATVALAHAAPQTRAIRELLASAKTTAYPLATTITVGQIPTGR